MTTSIDTLATSTAHAGATLNTTGALIDEAGLVIQDLAGVSDELANNLGFSVLGQQPLAGAAGKFRDFSVRLKAFQGMTGGLSDNLATNADDLTTLTAEIKQIGSTTADLAARVDAFDQAGEIVSLMVGGIILGGLLVLWLAIAAAFCAWAGWRLRKVAAAEARRAPRPGAPPSRRAAARPAARARCTSSTIRAVECPSTTSNDAFANASTRVTSKASALIAAASSAVVANTGPGRSAGKSR